MSENRKHTRSQIDRRVIYVSKNAGGEIESQGVGRVLDISADGMMFETSEPVHAKTIRVRSSTKDGDGIHADGLLIYSMPHSPGKYRNGIQFKGLFEETAKFVTEMRKQQR